MIRKTLDIKTQSLTPRCKSTLSKLYQEVKEEDPQEEEPMAEVAEEVASEEASVVEEV